MDAIAKLQPHRTIHLQGFNDFGATAALHSASATGFTVSGVFCDAADFAVLVLFDRDDFFGHPRFSYLPDGDFTGITLTFDVTYSGLQPIDSPKFASIDWPYLNVRRADNSLRQIRLFDHATQVGGSYTAASTSFTLVDNGFQPFDRVTLWYQNIAFDYIVPGAMEVEFPLFAQGTGFTHEITVAGVTYSHTEGPGEGSTDVANAMVAALASDPNVNASIGSAAHIVRLVRKQSTGASFVVSSTWGGSVTLWQVTAQTVCASIAAQINSASYSTIGLNAIASGTTVTITARQPGYDGNMIRIYEHHKNNSLYFTPSVRQLSGGSSDATWRVSIDFTAEDCTDVNKMWLTFAPRLADSAEYAASEWSAVFTNWSVTDALDKRPLKVAGPGSVRIEEDDKWAKYVGFWEDAPPYFFSQGRARRAAQMNATATIETHCSVTHDIYVGTRFDFDCGIVEARLDGGAPVPLDCWSWGQSSAESQANARQVRRKLFSNVTPGKHSVEIRLTGTKNVNSQGFYFYLDFIECAVASDVPDAPEMRTDIGVATDYDTDHTYKLAPQRLVWALRKIGFIAPIDHYVGVFWWNQRKRVGGTFPQLTVTFGGTWADGDAIFFTFGATTISKSVFPADTPESIAAHFCYFINGTFVGLWASVLGATLTVTVRSAAPNFGVVFTKSFSSAGGVITDSGSNSLIGGVMSEWVIDETVNPVLNRAARDWHANYYAELAAHGMSAVIAYSQELVLPPDTPPSSVWIQRFPNGEPVLTATGFANKSSAHCAFSPVFRDYIKRVYVETAAQLQTAGLPICLQFGEVLWWFFANVSGMAFYDAYTADEFQNVHGRAMHTFLTGNDDPGVNGYVDANFLRSLLKDHVDAVRAHVLASYPAAQFELLWPLDVNYPEMQQILHYINLPEEWKQKAGSGFDSFLVEGFQFAGVERNLEKVSRCAGYPFEELNWPRANVGYLMGIFNAGWPWEKDFLRGKRKRIPVLKMWAYDHLCLYGRGLPVPDENRYVVS